VFGTDGRITGNNDIVIIKNKQRKVNFSHYFILFDGPQRKQKRNLFFLQNKNDETKKKITKHQKKEEVISR